MGFFEGFILGRESLKGNNRGRSRGIYSNISFIIIIYFVYKWIEEISIEKFGPYFNELSITYILMTVLIYRYNYGEEGRSLSIDFIGVILTFANLFICCICGLVLFNKIGNTPFSYLINCWNVLEWNNSNFIGAIGEIMWFILKLLDIGTRIIGMNIVQLFLLKYFKKFLLNIK